MQPAVDVRLGQDVHDVNDDHERIKTQESLILRALLESFYHLADHELVVKSQRLLIYAIDVAQCLL